MPKKYQHNNKYASTKRFHYSSSAMPIISAATKPHAMTAMPTVVGFIAQKAQASNTDCALDQTQIEMFFTWVLRRDTHRHPPLLDLLGSSVGLKIQYKNATHPTTPDNRLRIIIKNTPSF